MEEIYSFSPLTALNIAKHPTPRYMIAYIKPIQLLDFTDVLLNETALPMLSNALIADGLTFGSTVDGLTSNRIAIDAPINVNNAVNRYFANASNDCEQKI